MLKLEQKEWYQVKEGQTLAQIASAFCVSARLLAKENGLRAEPNAGRILRIPQEQGNVYTVKERESKALLCGNEENFIRKNGTDILYLGMRVIL
ncbi:MAG: LysM peptidoglycan-binding domain-containing protein [Clostridia bacterium]|nr:LysM peptidoglycan-binding domain-containing protein [Clostridia bacterium]